MKVVLIGDSIRMGYQPLVAEKCPSVDVWGPAANCRHSLWALDHFQEWVADQEPHLVHVNFGIHDASLQPDGQHQILLPLPGAVHRQGEGAREHEDDMGHHHAALHE